MAFLRQVPFTLTLLQKAIPFGGGMILMIISA
jgi:hypothetical protein